MDEKKLRKQLVRMAVIIICSSAVLCAVVIGVFAYILRASHEADHTQMETETQEYENRILIQLDKNLQTLATLSTSYEVSDVVEDPQKLEQSIVETNKVTSFVSMAYIPRKGEGVLNTPGHGTRNDFSLNDCSEYAKEAIQRSLQGENAISKMFDSEVSDTKLFVYSVPVYQDGSIVGALAASDTLDIFKDIVNGNTVMGGRGYIHILDAKGNFLVRSENTLVKESVTSIFDGPYLSENARSMAQNAFSNRESMFGDFEYRGEKCHFYLEPMNFNGWYLFCADRRWSAILPFGNTILLIGGAFIFILLLSLVLLCIGYHKFRKSAALLLQMAYFDSVTGARNTVSFDRDFTEISKTKKNYTIAALNVHNFKGVNDLFGIAGGNRVLRYIKQVIEENLKEGEIFCRAAADMFYILFFGTDKQALTTRVEQIITTVREATTHADYSYEVSLYSGLAVQGDREKALVALQSIQHTHRINTAFYNAELHEKLRKKNIIESYMQTALQNKEFKLFLQPKYSFKDDSLASAEALVRWQKPDGSYRYPDEFIPLFEENGFCIKLDLYMVERACEQIRGWIDAGIKPIPISVNQSKLLFLDRNYPAHLEEIVKRYNVHPSFIMLEILEDLAASDLGQINAQIETLHAKGFKVSMDDFGSGYSSLNMLYQLNIDELKFDRGFLRQGPETNHERRQIILEQIIQCAQKFGISTVAEGVETKQDRDNMAILGCDYGQGYFYERPISAAQFSEKYMNGRR